MKERREPVQDPAFYKEDNEWMRFALLSAGLGIWDMDPVNGTISWDDRCRELCGIASGGDITYEELLQYVHPDDRPSVIEAIAATLRKKSTGKYQARFRTIGADDGKLRWLHCMGTAYFNAEGVAYRFAGALQDITPEMKAQELQQILFSLVENSQDFMGTADTSNKFYYINPHGRELLGISPDTEITQLPTSAVYSPEDFKTAEMAYQELAKEGKWSGILHLQHLTTKERIPFRAHFAEITDPVSGKVIGRGASLHDLRAELNAQKEQQKLLALLMNNEQELERLVEIRTSELKKANIDLNIVNQNLEQFAYVASHDLQEPLRKINMFSALLQDKYRDQLNENGVRNLDIIRNAATRMTTLIQDLLAFSRVSRQDHLFEKIDLQKVLQQVLVDVDVLIQQKNASIITDGLCMITGIPLHMNQLFQNLLSNALKFSRKEVAPVIEISSRLLEQGEIDSHPQLQNGTAYCEIRIKDNGIGFAPAYAKKIFVIFQRLHGRGEYEGSGIGLALCQKIVTAHHGVIYAESENGEGATFVVILPVAV